ncbi:hypothetical protein D3C77_532230 [compost metagenome]
MLPGSRSIKIASTKLVKINPAAKIKGALYPPASSSQPPIGAPSKEPMEMPVSAMPMTAPRRFAGNNAASSAIEAVSVAAAAMPCTKRAPISIHIELAKAKNKVESTMPIKPIIIGTTLPILSDIAAKSGVVINTPTA